MPSKISRRIFIKKIFGSIISLLVAGTGGYYYAKEIEPKSLTITRHMISHPRIPQSFNQFKMVQFSDTHLGFQFTLEQLNKLVDRINQLKPDVVFFTGDLMDEPNKFANSNQIIPILLKLNAPFGKFAIYGNHDHGGYGTDLYHTIMDQSGFVVLKNEGFEIKLVDQSSHSHYWS